MCLDMYRCVCRHVFRHGVRCVAWQREIERMEGVVRRLDDELRTATMERHEADERLAKLQRRVAELEVSFDEKNSTEKSARSALRERDGRIDELDAVVKVEAARRSSAEEQLAQLELSKMAVDAERLEASSVANLLRSELEAEKARTKVPWSLAQYRYYMYY